MPIYEYQCTACGHVFELIRAIKQADEPASCPNCSAQNARRALSLVNAFSSGHSLTHSASSCDGCNSGNCSTCGL